MASADTNVILRWTLEGDTPAAKLAERLLLGDESVHVADVAIMEAVFVMEKGYGLSRAVVAGHVRSLMSISNINCNRTLFSTALDWYEQLPKLSIVDCCLAEYASLNNAEPLYTFDRKLANQLQPAALLAS